jgi:molybdenum cofactor cytidylyltransferase
VPDRIAIILLAAGGSSRMGRPKQLLPLAGRTLLRRAAETALATPCRPVVVVLGDRASNLMPELAGLDVYACENADWRDGMGSSIKAGIRCALERDPALDAVLLALCDQPLVGPDELGRLIDAARRTARPIVAAAYPGSPGVPALFTRPMFAELLAIEDAAGAKSLMTASPQAVETVAIAGALADVDTPGDYARLTESHAPEGAE